VIVDLDTRLLRGFVAVADELNFTRAAERLTLAQQALSAQIRQLEQRLGTQLFERTTRKVRLTEAGELLLPHARAVLASLDAGTEALAAAQRAELATLRVGLAGTAVLPITFSWCEWQQQTGGGMPSGTTVRTIYFTKTSNTTGCTGPSNNIVPGGFAYLDTDPGKCGAFTRLGGRWTSSTGNSVPSPCSTTDFSKWVGQTVLLPLFEESGDTGSNAWYRVYGYAAFKLTGYSLGGQFNTSPKPCSGNERCLSGYFTRFVELSDAWNYSADAPHMGAWILRLIR